MNFSSKLMLIPDTSLIQPHKKEVPYTIIPIGGPEELKAWRKEQAILAEARETLLKPIREATRARAVSMVANQNADTTPDTVSLAEKEHLQARNAKPAQTAPKFTWVAPEEPKKTLSDKLKDILSGVWKSAGFNKD